MPFRRMLLAAALAACDGGSVEAGEPSAEPSPSEPARPNLYVHRARRCGECHESIHSEWSASAHATSEASPLYRQMARAAGSELCARCHVPLASRLPAGSAPIADGVSCEVCHTMARVEPSPLGPTWSLELGDSRRYAPLCDATDHYFHRMGCSPLHSTSTFCAGCHSFRWRTAEGHELPVLTEVDEWQASDFGAQEIQCQECHMPQEAGEVATGAGERSARSHHGFLGTGGELRLDAIEMTVQASASASAVEVNVTLTNLAGHATPTGFPGRELILSARIERAGGPGARSERRYARRLVDAEGREAPFYEAVREASDDRLRAREARQETLTLAAPDEGELVVSLEWRALSGALAERLSASEVEQSVLAEARTTIGPPHRRSGTPQRLRVSRGGVR